MTLTQQAHRPIVVGYDGSPGATSALDWAAGEADCRGVPLRVVKAWTPGEFGTDADQAGYSEEQLDRAVSAVLDGRNIEWSAVAEKGSAAKVLLGQAQDAQMLVVGSRGHGALSGFALGSVGIHVTTHEGAPVVVVIRSPSR